MTDTVGLAQRDKSRNEILTEELETLLATITEVPDLAIVFQGPMTLDEWQARQTARWLEEVAYHCSGCKHPFVEGDMIYRVRSRERPGSPWLPPAATFCIECAQTKMHPSWWGTREQAVACEGRCGVTVTSSYRRYDRNYDAQPYYTVCGERCAKIARTIRRRGDRSDRSCAGCGEPFTPKRADARYCSGACRQAAYRARNTA